MDGSTGECLCPDNMILDSDGYCRCPAGYSFVPSKGKCLKLECPNGDGGSCFLGGQECGFNCTNTSDAAAVTCSNGFCRANLCDEEKIFSVREKSIPGNFYYWGCQLKDKPNCSKIDDTVYCFNDEVENQWYHCCIATKDGKCEIGLCDIYACPEGGEYYTIQDTTIYGGACLFEKGTSDTQDDIVCRPKNTFQTVWDCYYETTGVQCATSCSAENPKDCCPENDPCNGKGTYKEGGYCCFTNLSGQYVCMKNTYAYIENDVCGSLCTASNYVKQTDGSYTASIKCNFGLCQDPEDGNESCSSFGGEFKLIQYGSDPFYSRYACVKDDLGCFNTTSGYGPYSCFLNKSSCGESCDDLAGNGCKIWHQKTCAPQITVGGITKPACTYSQPIWENGDTETAYIYDCHCQGDEVDYNGKKYCCPTGQVIQDGTCIVEQ